MFRKVNIGCGDVISAVGYLECQNFISLLFLSSRKLNVQVSVHLAVALSEISADHWL